MIDNTTMHIQDPSIPDPPRGDKEPNGSVSGEWFLHSPSLCVFVRFRWIKDSIRIQWWSSPNEEWRNWDTDYANAYCPLWDARRIYHHIASNEYFPFKLNINPMAENICDTYYALNA